MCKDREAVLTARRQHSTLCLPGAACGPFAGKATSFFDLPLLCPLLCQVLGSKPDSPMLCLGREAPKSSGHCASHWLKVMWMPQPRNGFRGQHF